MLQGACCWGSFIYLGDLQPCLLLVGAAGWARSQQSLGTHLCQLLAQFSMGCCSCPTRDRPWQLWEQFRQLPDC